MKAILWGMLVSLTGCAAPSLASEAVGVQIIDRASGQALPVYASAGKHFVAGKSGDKYAVRIKNHTVGRVLVVLSVDGVNAVTGQTAAPHQSGYVLGPYESHDVAGWRKSLNEVAQFYFTALPDSYAARTDRFEHVGVVGVAVFREKAPAVSLHDADRKRDGREPVAAGAAKSMPREERLGTGHGEREQAKVVHTNFVRATKLPEQTVAFYYDGHASLVARGVIPSPRYAEPNPFPGSFVPDPRG
jgi:hypothetical protein